MTRLAPTDLRQTLRISGEARPLHRTTISAQVSGIVETVPYLPGESVAAASELLKIAPEDYRLALAAEEASLVSLTVELRTAQASLDRANRLASSGTMSGAALEQAQSAVDMLKAGISGAETRIRLARLDLDRTTVHAPFNGTLATRTVEPGQMVQAGDALFSLVDLSTMLVEVQVPVDLSPGLSRGQVAELYSPYRPDHLIVAEVRGIGPQVMTGTRSVPVWLEIENVDAGLRAGTFLVGDIILRQKRDRLAIPPTALLSGDELGKVLLIRDGVARAVPVTLGETWHDGALVEVTSGLHAGETVVILPLQGLQAGDTVMIGGRN